MSIEKSRGHDRTRTWSLIVYPDSAPDNWRSLIDDFHIQWIESPLHEFDTEATSGELKKPHWHVVLAFDGPKSFEQVAEISKSIHGPIPQRCQSLKGAIRYMAHLDNPEKYQYPVDAIIPHGGFDLADALRPSSSERYSKISEMIAWCSDNNVTEFYDLLNYARTEHFDDWFPFLCDNSAFIMSQYLKSAHYKFEKHSTP